MKHIGCVLVALLGACVIAKQGKDGDHCESASDCASDSCMGNICVGSDCGDGAVCPASFSCYHYDGDDIFGLGDHYACRLRCDAQGACPPQWTCYQGDSYCSLVGPTVTVAISNLTPRAHEVVTFTGQIDPPVVELDWNWTFFNLGMKTGSSIEMTFDAGEWNWTVDATNAAGAEHYESGFIDVCAVAGDTCDPYGRGCCSDLTCNPATMMCE